MINRILLQTALALFLIIPGAFACQSHVVTTFNYPAQGVVGDSAACGSGIRAGYVNLRLYYLNGSLYAAFECLGAVSSCYIGYETSLNGINWSYQPLSVGVAYNVLANKGWFYLVFANETFDGTQFGVRAGPCGSRHCRLATILP